MSSYIDHREQCSGRLVHSWSDMMAERLLWTYGPDRALAILLGQDEKTNLDIEAWRNLGKEK